MLAGGHAGYEMAPLVPTIEAIAWAVMSRGAPATGLNTVKHHDMHHRFNRFHFSLYFTHWDRWWVLLVFVLLEQLSSCASVADVCAFRCWAIPGARASCCCLTHRITVKRA